MDSEQTDGDRGGGDGGGGGGEGSTPSNLDRMSPHQKQVFLDKVKASNQACSEGDFHTAVLLYTQALEMDPGNAILHSNRSAALVKLGQGHRALQDAIRARDISPKWGKAYYRQGVALQSLGRPAEALAAFASGLAQEPKSTQLLAGLVEAAMKSPLRATLEPTYRQLQTMRLDKSPFVMISVIGQELLAAGHYSSAVVVLESALRIGTCSLKLRGSVFSALSSAYWALNSLDKALNYMQQDLAVAKALGDIAGECRAHGNLGSAYFSKGCFREALTSHRYQLVLAMKCKDTAAAAVALTSLGHVYTAIGDFSNGLASHKQCVQLVKQIGDKLQEAREIGNVGAVYLATGDFDNAVQCHMEHLRIAKELGNRVEEARAYSNLGSSHHYKRNFEQAITFHNHVLVIAQELRDKTIEARAYAGLGHAARCMGDYVQAKKWHEKQLDMALATKDKVGEGRACSNLGIVYQLLGDQDAALKLHQAHLNIARALGDRAGMGRAYGNIGNAYSAMGYYDQAIKYHKQELTISKEVNDRNSEASTHGNLAVAYQAVGMHEMALLHYHSHLGIARELKDTAGEACALCNLGNCHSSRGEFGEAVPYYEQYLMLSQELQDVEGEAKACHFLGYAHYCLGNFKEAIRYYEQDLSLAKDLQDRMSMGRAYCNLGLAHLALQHLQKALDCQKYFLAIAHMMKHASGKFRALGNIGDVLMKQGNVDEAIKIYQKQLVLAKSVRDKGLEGSAFGALGQVHRQLKRLDKALGFHTQELALRREIGDVRGECRAQSHLGAVHTALGNHAGAVRAYTEQLEKSRALRDSGLEAQAYGNLGIAHLNMREPQKANAFFRQQLSILNQLSSTSAAIDKMYALENMGTCYTVLGEHSSALHCHEEQLRLALQSKSLQKQEAAYKALGTTHKALGNLQEALVNFEKRLVVSHELATPQLKASAYGDLGNIHRELGQYEQAMSCLEHQMSIARELGDRLLEGEAAAGLGRVYHCMGDPTRALKYHQLDLSLGEETGQKRAQARAFHNIGEAYEALGNLQDALGYQKDFLCLASQLQDQEAKTSAYASLGRIHLSMGRMGEALASFEAGLELAEGQGHWEEEARLRHQMGITLWKEGNLEDAALQLRKASTLLDTLRKQSQWSKDQRRNAFHLQTETLHSLQKVLVCLGRLEEALLAAEWEKCRIPLEVGRGKEHCPATPAALMELVRRQKASVLYFSIIGSTLFTWLITPQKGVVEFVEQSLEVEGGEGTLIEQHLENMRESLGVNVNSSVTSPACADGGSGRENVEEEEGNYLRFFNRSHLLNASSYSLSSLFSLGSVTGSIASEAGSRCGSMRSAGPSWQGPSCLLALYELLVAPMDQFLPPPSQPRELMLVLDGDLHLVPWPVLKGPSCNEFLCERFSLLVLPSLSALRTGHKGKSLVASEEIPSSVVVGNPALPNAVRAEWGWPNLPYAEQEANIVGELLGAKPLVGPAATKENVLRELADAQCIHLATHVSWQLSALVVSPGGIVEPGPIKDKENGEDQETASDLSTSLEVPPPSEFLLTATDILNLKLSAKLVVVSSCHTRDERQGRASTQGVLRLVRSLLAAGAHCVLVSLWPVPDTAVKILLRTFYSSLLQGARLSRALSEAMMTVQHTKHFAHPANWAGFLLFGVDARLSNKVALMGQALCQLLSTPDKCRHALRVTLHLVEKSLQRINRGHKNAMYTTQQSIANKVGEVQGWKDLLMSVGFRFEPPANGIPASVFFPQSDAAGRLPQCSASLQALLGLSSASVQALAKLLISPEAAEDLIGIVRDVIGQFTSHELDMESIEVPMSMSLWRRPGCHELLASLGFDLMEVGRDQVHLRTGKQANKRSIHFALQALLALFDTQEAPRSLSLDESSSLESLESSSLSHAEDELEDEDEERRDRTSTSPMALFGKGGAFASYVRSRGEPDGRTAATNESKRSESDANFTPSPVDPSHKAGFHLPLQTSPKVSLALSHQTKIRSMYESSSSASSLTDWEASSTARKAVRTTNDPTITTVDSIQDHIIATQMTRLNREAPLTDVYRDRHVGLGLAPPLSKLLMSVSKEDIVLSEAENKSGSDDTYGNLDQVSVAEGTTYSLPVVPPVVPPVPPKRVPPPKQWALPGHRHELPRRSDGDGRSMTESNYAACSPQDAKTRGILRADYAAFNPAYEDENETPTGSAATLDASQVEEITEYIEEVLKPRTGSEERRSSGKGSRGSRLSGGWTRPFKVFHPGASNTTH